MNQNFLIKLVSAFFFLIGISAVMGGYEFVIGNDIVPREVLRTTPFTSFFWPGLMLLIIIGGTQIVASIVLWIKHKYALEAMAIAAYGLLIWMFVEVFIMPDHHWLQPTYFALAVVELIIVMLLLKYKRLSFK